MKKHQKHRKHQRGKQAGGLQTQRWHIAKRNEKSAGWRVLVNYGAFGDWWNQG